MIIFLYLIGINIIFIHFWFPNSPTKVLHFLKKMLPSLDKIQGINRVAIYFFLFNKWNADFLKFVLYSSLANQRIKWYLLKFCLLNTNQSPKFSISKWSTDLYINSGNLWINKVMSFTQPNSQWWGKDTIKPAIRDRGKWKTLELLWKAPWDEQSFLNTFDFAFWA